jgi:hypothetical protein
MCNEEEGHACLPQGLLVSAPTLITCRRARELTLNNKEVTGITWENNKKRG